MADVGGSVANYLWTAAWPSAERSLYHPFVLGLADSSGRVPIEVFKHYVAQDATFLRAYAESYALVQQKLHPEDVAGREAFEVFIQANQSELELHRGYSESLGIDLDGPEAEPSPATLAYTDFLLAAANDPNTSPAHVLAAMAPCMRLYSFLGMTLACAFPDYLDMSPYSKWVAEYSDPEFQQVAAAVEAQLDIYASAALEDPEHGEQELECLQGYYNEAMELEFNFFDSQQVGDEGLEQSRETVGMMMQNMMSNIIEQQGEELQ
jgi:thiaminase/transcriptional activator TenA